LIHKYSEIAIEILPVVRSLPLGKRQAASGKRQAASGKRQAAFVYIGVHS
jgi:hypothetical protein